MLSIGLDVHLRCSCLCILDGHGKKAKQMTIGGSWAQVRTGLSGGPSNGDAD
ncbi:MAG: hypothetical protein IID37_16945 [Planctomycetes bacterium]|nr:hypothetical protein [Planctomycetota bacterium]